MDANKTGKIIKDARLAKNMTQKELADQISVSTFAVSKWENGRGMPDISYLQPIASTLDVSLNELILGEKQMTTLKDDATVKQLINEAVKQTKKRIFRISMLMISSVIVITSSILIYLYYHPSVSLSRTAIVTNQGDPNTSVFEMPKVTVDTWYGLPVYKKLSDNLLDFNNKNAALVSDAFNNNVNPVRLKCYAEVKDGKTIVTYTGTTKNDDFYKQLVFDYVIVDETRNFMKD
jgi:transcriptional regulator with XRE-family HTH domain